MLELLFLLLPVAAFYGWYMGQRSARNKNEVQKVGSLGNLIKGINYFLNHDRKKAADEFSNYYVSKTDHSFDESLVIGSIFREKGELEKAISFHNNIITMSGLTSQERSAALIELARDFIQAGLLDRAEAILKELITYIKDRKTPCRLLVEIYEQEKEWKKAIEAVNTFKSTFGDSLKKEEAEFYCELGNESYSLKKIDEAQDLFKKALKINNKCVRARLNLAKIAIENKKFDAALYELNEIATTDKEMVSLCVKHLARCYQDDNDEEKHLEVLEKWLSVSCSEAVALAIVDILLKKDGTQSAEEFALRYLKTMSSISMFVKLFSYKLEQIEPSEREKLSVLKSLLEAQQVRTQKYVCHHCGFRSQVLFWQCPSCHNWETMKPNKSSNLSQEKITPV